MYKMRKNLAIVFLLFIIVVSLLFSNIFKQYRLEGMTTTSVDDIEKPAEGTDTDIDSAGPVVKPDSDSDKPDEETDSDGPVVKPDSDSDGPVVKPDSDSDGPVVETDADSSGPVVETDSDSDGPVVKPDSDSDGPVVETDSDSSGPVVKTTDDTKPEDDASSYKESFQTRLVGTPINYKSAPQTTILDDSLRAKPEINGVFNHIFGFSNNQVFHVKQP